MFEARKCVQLPLEFDLVTQTSPWFDFHYDASVLGQQGPHGGGENYG